MNSRRCVALAAIAGAACNEPPPRPRPVEIPISQYRVEGASARGSSWSTDASAPAGASADRDREATVANVAEEPRGAAATTTTDAPSRALDLKGGFLGATLGAAPRVFRGLVLLDKKGDLATYRAGDKSYGGFPLKDVLYVFRGGKLATIQFTVKNAADCKPLRETLVKELGAPQRASGESTTWRGEKVGLRFVIGSTGTCAGAVQSKDLARAEWESL